MYIGSAPGLSIPVLHKIFKKWIHKWILYDPGQFVGTFCKELVELNKSGPEFFELHSKYFDDECAKELANLNLINIVVLDDHRTDDTSRDKMIQDFHDSGRWIALIGKILGAWVKFRLPWSESDEDSVEGINGNLVLQPWTAKDSAECRLIVSPDHRTTTYNLREHAQKMFQYNMIHRWQTQCAPHNIDLPGLDRGQDSHAFLHTVCCMLYILLSIS